MRPLFRSLNPLNRKLLRDLLRIRGQAMAIILVIGAGVALFVMSRDMMISLDETMRAYYERHRFADVYAPAKRAPDHLLTDIRAIDGVADVEGRISGAGLVDLPSASAPISARILSFDPTAQASINRIYLASGRMVDPTRTDEVMLLKPFAEAHGLTPGDSIAVTMHGVRHDFKIAGLALSPEFIYAIPPGEFVIDAGRYAVMWANEETLEAAYDLDGAFNEAVLTLSRGANKTQIIDDLDRLLAPYGAVGAYGREDQISNKYLIEELKQLDTMGKVLPPIFLAVSMFLLNIVITRLVHQEREQIGLIKAFGYTNREVGAHYFKFVIVIAVLGALVGWLGGLWLGHGIAKIYQFYFHFPFLIFTPDFSTLGVAVIVSCAAATLGAFIAVRGAVRLNPADAMRPPAPPGYRQGGEWSRRISEFLDQPSRMILRRIVRQPVRAAMTTFGVGAAMALSVMMRFNVEATNTMLDVSFTITDRSDVLVTFVEPLSTQTILELEKMDGVDYVEPFRSSPVQFVNDRTRRLGAINGVPENAVLNRAVDADLRAVDVRGEGILLSKKLSEILIVSVGDTLRLEVREGRRPALDVPVVGLIDSLIGTPAYMNIDALNKQLKEPRRASGAYLKIDWRKREMVYRELKAIPMIAGVSLRREAYDNFKKMIDEGFGTFRAIMTMFSVVIAAGVVYNAARIAFIERGRDLASLRVLGFTKIESGYVLLGELAALAILALPVGSVLGYLFWVYLAGAMSTELYQIPVVYNAAGLGVAGVIILASAAITGAFIQRDVSKIDLPAALKMRE